MPNLVHVDIILLDIDGVLLPFGGTKNAEQYSDGRFHTTQGCIFPDCTMDALTSLLYRANNLFLDDKQKQCKHSTNSINDASSTSSCKLVLSSTWRARSDFIQDILDSFRVYATEKARSDPTVMKIWEPYLHSFFDITDPNFHSTRHAEIYSWVRNVHDIARNFIVRSWIALDDEDLVNVEGKMSQDAMDHSVFVKSSVGLTLEDVSLGIQLLERQHSILYSNVHR